jgi:hypothetical protein
MPEGKVEEKAEVEKKIEEKLGRDDILRMKDDEIIKLVLDDYAKSKKQRDKINIRNKRYRDLYFQKDNTNKVSNEQDPQASSSGRCQLFIGIVRSIVDTAISMISQSIFSVQPFVKIEPTEEGDQKASANFEEFFAFRSSRQQMNLKWFLKNQWLFQACLYDYSIAKMGWLMKSGYIPQVVSETPLPNLKQFRYRTKEEKIEMQPVFDAVDRPEIEILNTLLTYPDPSATDFDDSRFFIYLADTNKSALKRREKTIENPFGAYENIDKIEANSYIAKEGIQKTEGKIAGESEDGSDTDLVEQMFYYTPDAMVVLANRKWVIKKEQIFGYPFSKMTYVQPNHQWSGVGLVEGIEDLQLDINFITRLARDNRNLIVNAIGIVNRQLFGVKADLDFKQKPGKMYEIRYGDPSKAIYWHHIPDTTQGLEQDKEFDLRMVERIVGFGETQMGTWRGGGRRTATEADYVAEGANTRLGEIAREIEEKNIVDVVYFDYNLEQMYLSTEAQFRIMGRHGVDFRRFAKKDILHRGAFDIIPVGSRYEINRSLKTNQFLQGLDRLNQNQFFQQIADHKEVYKAMWSRLGEKDPDRFIMDESENNMMIPPDMENILLGAGHDLSIGNRDNHAQHIAIHTTYYSVGETSQVPPENIPKFEAHIALHQQAQTMLVQGANAPTGTPPGGMPEEKGNILAQPFDQTYAGGTRTPASPEVAGNMPGGMPGMGGGE